MKKTSVYLVLVCIVLALAAYLGYSNLFPQAEPPYDDDQEGLSGQIVFKFSHVVAENTPKGQAAAKFAELVAEKSNGKIQIVVFPNGSLYSDIEEINALKDGQVQIIAPSTSKLGELSPKWGILDLPFAFGSHEAMQRGIHGDIGQKLLESLQENELVGLAHWSNGFKQITTNTGPVLNPADLTGQKLRIMPNEIIREQFRLLGVESHEESFNSTYNLIEAGKVDGEENTISNIYSKKFYNVQQHLTISNHGYLGYAVMMDQNVWNQQSDDTKRILLEAMEETTAWNDKNAIKINEEQLALIKQQSDIQIHELTAAQKQQWAEKLAPLYEQFSGEIGTDLLEELETLQESYKTTP
ncbi:DctP family TRAP transporter solute-binding subunit [Planomicrobium sp. CPCC 101079]|uniref:DctP family TRAP transporter solute-binding subunit n=1 Tax=Planomicrobium sp. CPCC 101079 TaxID=2599618 RepID=UPI0011B42605|nr:DctP family TRAP transporter solute-binding subunit [Planomicrobium sp. CPCC 101079]TWT00506.1 DctP family TRAP transporter solute-binding subunit [Planomicrobium sp. CPCC 101079]